MSDHDLMQEYYGLLREDFGAFAAGSFGELFGERPLIMGPHIEVMLSRFTDVREGRTRPF